MSGSEKRVHISDQTWKELENGTVDSDGYIKILEHTGACNLCAAQFAQTMEASNQLLEPPQYLKHQIICQSRQIAASIKTKARNTSKKLQLMLYSLKVSAAVVACVIILGLTSNGYDRTLAMDAASGASDESVLSKVNNALDGITNTINNISNSIFNKGDKK